MLLPSVTFLVKPTDVPSVLRYVVNGYQTLFGVVVCLLEVAQMLLPSHRFQRSTSPSSACQRRLGGGLVGQSLVVGLVQTNMFSCMLESSGGLLRLFDA